MGMMYSAAKMGKPEAWALGKDNSNSIFVKLFPVAKHNLHEGYTKIALASLTNTLIPVHYVIGQKPFVLAEQYKSKDAFKKAIDRLGFPLDNENLLAFYDWAGSDPISIIGDFEYGEIDSREFDYLKVDVSRYRYMDSYEGVPGRMALVPEEMCEMCEDEGVVTDQEGNDRRCPCQDE